MGKVFLEWFDEDSEVFRCRSCRAHLALKEEIVSKHFQGQTGQAWLFERVINVSFGPATDRALTTGLHRVSDVYCTGCHNYCGWFYERAFEESQQYKEGKYILERALIVEHAPPSLAAAAPAGNADREAAAAQ